MGPSKHEERPGLKNYNFALIPTAFFLLQPSSQEKSRSISFGVAPLSRVLPGWPVWARWRLWLSEKVKNWPPRGPRPRLSVRGGASRRGGGRDQLVVLGDHQGRSGGRQRGGGGEGRWCCEEDRDGGTKVPVGAWPFWSVMGLGLFWRTSEVKG